VGHTSGPREAESSAARSSSLPIPRRATHPLSASSSLSSGCRSPHSGGSKPRVNPNSHAHSRKWFALPDEDEVADGAEASQDGGDGSQTEQPQAEAEAQAGGEGRPPRTQEATHRLLLLHVCSVLSPPLLICLLRISCLLVVTALASAKRLIS